MSDGLGIGRRRLIGKIVASNWGKDAEERSYRYTDMLYVIQEMLDEEGKKYHGQKSSLRGHSIFRGFVKHMLYRNLANYDSMVLMTSEKGTGKSSAAIMMAREWCRQIGIKFDPKRHIAYNNADVMNKIDALNKFEPLICDEAIRFACLSGQTKIKTPNGLVKIKDLVGKENFEVCSYNEKTKKEEIKTAKKCIKTKEDVVYEIKTADGKTIKATKEHKFLTNNGWKELQHLDEGDELVGL